MAEKPLKPRKRPLQERSRATVDAILEAAARVFARRGHGGGTTNRIASEAGVSIGSLYEYFPNKDAILVALAERQLDAMLARVQEQLDDAPSPARADALLERFVRAMLEVHELEPDLHRLVFSEAPHPPELHACVLKMEGGLVESLQRLLLRSEDLRLTDSHTAAHLVVQTAEALTHRYVHHGIHDLPREAFVREVVALLRAYLCDDRAAS